MKNSDYWKLRFSQLEAAQNQEGAAVRAELERQYRRAERELEGKISAWYQRLAANNGVSMAEARRMLSANELKEFRWDVKEYIRYGQENELDGRWMKELENASARFHISRLEALKLQTQQSLEVLFGNQLDSVDAAMKRIYLDGYYHTAYELQKGFGIGWDIAGIDQAAVEKVICKPWAVDGKNFSERIWGNRQKLIGEVHNELTQNIMLGADPQKAIDSIAHKMGNSRYNAGRLVMTEEAYFSSAAQKDCFDELGVEQYEIVATLDSHTSEICRRLDGQVFPMKDYQAGVTAPPFHVFCRSTTVPYFEDDFGQSGERAAKGEDGKTYYVPADMSYGEWKKKFVDNSQPADNPQSKATADYLIRSHVPGQDITNERGIVEDTISSMPKKVKEALEQGTIVDIGKDGASQYDYDHDILYIAKGSNEVAVIHEIGHMVENKLLKTAQVAGMRKKVVKDISIFDLDNDIFLDNAGNAKEIFFVKNNRFVSDYQGRIYVDDIFEAFEPDGAFKDDLLWEYVSEAFREYIQNPDRLKAKDIELYNLIAEAVE
ncbi:MAG: minor capsid protein [Lachnospiraceae bacterium]|nr:minor capsid protein [Lachnospiraceae bacterium]